MLKYEYSFIPLNFTDVIAEGSNVRVIVNKMGSEGWELFNMVPAVISHQYDFLEGMGPPEYNPDEQRVINDYVITYVASFRRSIA